MISNQGSISTQARAIAGLSKGNLAFYWTFKLRNLNHQNLEQPPFALFFSMLSAPWRKRRKPARRSTLATCGPAIPSGPAVPHSPTSQTRSRADKRRLLPLRRLCFSRAIPPLRCWSTLHPSSSCFLGRYSHAEWH